MRRFRDHEPPNTLNLKSFLVPPQEFGVQGLLRVMHRNPYILNCNRSGCFFQGRFSQCECESECTEFKVQEEFLELSVTLNPTDPRPKARNHEPKPDASNREASLQIRVEGDFPLKTLNPKP